MSSAAATTPADPWAPPYPQAHREPVLETLHGVAIADPYRWMEDQNHPALPAWIAAQNALFRRWVGAVPARGAYEERLTKLWNYAREGLPTKAGGRLFFTRNDGLQNQAVHYVRPLEGGAPQVFLDPNLLDAEGRVSVVRFVPSEDAAHVAYGLSQGGSDWVTLRVRETATGRDLPDVLEWSKFSAVAWAPDGTGFYYGRYPAPVAGQALAQENLHHRLFFHRLGTPQEADRLVLEDPAEPRMIFSPSVTEDGRWLVVSTFKGSSNANGVFLRAADAPDAPPTPLFDAYDARYQVVGTDGQRLLIRTDKDAPRWRLVRVDPADPAPQRWETVIPEGEHVLDEAARFGRFLVAAHLVDATSRLTVYDLAGRLLGEVPLPALGTIGGLSGKEEDEAFWFSFTSFNYATAVFRYDLASRQLSEHFRPALDFDPSAFTVTREFATSRDGTRVPLFLFRRADAPADAPRPAILTAYGGFNVSLSPTFSLSALAWVEQGHTWALAILRGGGEYGEAWHEAGMKGRKQNVFDDFIAAGEHLVARGLTTPAQLGVTGGSNGGLLTAACMLQRPDLFGAVRVDVGVLDMLRFHKFTIGWAWVPEYGSADQAADFAWLLRYSPLHNLRPGVGYPPTLITTADRDDRVVPAHSFKFAAALQEIQTGPHPVLLRVQTDSGHGAGLSTARTIALQSDLLAFFTQTLAR